MKRPLADYRPIGPFAVKKSRVGGITAEEGDEEFMLTFHLMKDVSQYDDKPHNANFASFVKSALQESMVMFSTAYRTEPNKSPFNEDTYKCIGKMSNQDSLPVDKVKRDINEKVYESLPIGYKVVDITIESYTKERNQ